MYVTAEEAKEKWCPLVRASYSQDDQNAFNAGILPDERTPACARCIGNRCMFWRENSDGLGWCGVAGKPTYD